MSAGVESTPEDRRLSGAEQALSASQRDLRLTIDTIPARWCGRPAPTVQSIS